MNAAEKNRFLIQVIGINGVIRSSSLISGLNAQKLDFNVLNGVVPTRDEFLNSKLHYSFISNLICQRKLSIGEVGCASSHKQAAANLLNSNYYFGLTFEDDAEILRDLNFEELAVHLSSDNPTIINLGWIPGYAISAENKTQNINSILEVLTPPTCAFSYAFNKSAAELIVNDFSKIIDVADWPINLLNRARFYVVNPAWIQASQNPDNSTIGIRVKQPKNLVYSNFSSRFRLLFSLFSLCLWAPFTSRKITYKQILHRLVLRDALFKIGRAEMSNGLSAYTENEIVFLNPRTSRFSKFLKMH